MWSFVAFSHCLLETAFYCLLICIIGNILGLLFSFVCMQVGTFATIKVPTFWYFKEMETRNFKARHISQLHKKRLPNLECYEIQSSVGLVPKDLLMSNECSTSIQNVLYSFRIPLATIDVCLLVFWDVLSDVLN